MTLLSVVCQIEYRATYMTSVKRREGVNKFKAPFFS